jgi:hypothetical protein
LVFNTIFYEIIDNVYRTAAEGLLASLSMPLYFYSGAAVPGDKAVMIFRIPPIIAAMLNIKKKLAQVFDNLKKMKLHNNKKNARIKNAISFLSQEITSVILSAKYYSICFYLLTYILIIYFYHITPLQITLSCLIAECKNISRECQNHLHK